MLRRAALVLISLLLMVQIAQAQGVDCPAFVARALEQAAGNCDGLERNSACYGYNMLQTTFSVEVAPEFFTQPADRTELTPLQSIQTAPLNTSTGEWGVAIMNVQANVPTVLPGQAVTFILLGETTVENRVPAEVAAIPVEPIVLTAQSETPVRALPDENGDVVGSVFAGMPIEVDAIDASGAWVRTLFADSDAWVLRSAFAEAPEVDTLPIASNPSPMQAYYLRTGVGVPSCVQAPNVVAVRGPEDITVNLNANGAELSIGSLLLQQQISPTEMRLTVREGAVTIEGGARTIETDQTVLATLNEEDGVITAFGDIRQATTEELALGNTVYAFLGRYLPNSYPEVPHIVLRGDTLFSIARLYDADVQAIIARNNISDRNRILVGQRLIIPNPGRGFRVPLAPTSAPTATPQAGAPTPTPTTGGGAPAPTNTPTATTVAGVDCSNLRVTGPSQIVYGVNNFTWQGATGVTSYRVLLRNPSTGITLGYDTPAANTSVNGLVEESTIGAGQQFTVAIEAYLNNNRVCTSPTITVPIEGGEPIEATPTPTATTQQGAATATPTTAGSVLTITPTATTQAESTATPAADTATPTPIVTEDVTPTLDIVTPAETSTPTATATPSDTPTQGPPFTVPPLETVPATQTPSLTPEPQLQGSWTCNGTSSITITFSGALDADDVVSITFTATTPSGTPGEDTVQEVFSPPLPGPAGSYTYTLPTPNTFVSDGVIGTNSGRVFRLNPNVLRCA
ncbi:MAG: hypothetical protein OHK0046_12950 [Anaerolineae bacterium]